MWHLGIRTSARQISSFFKGFSFSSRLSLTETSGNVEILLSRNLLFATQFLLSLLTWLYTRDCSIVKFQADLFSCFKQCKKVLLYIRDVTGATLAPVQAKTNICIFKIRLWSYPLWHPWYIACFEFKSDLIWSTFKVIRVFQVWL